MALRRPDRRQKTTRDTKGQREGGGSTTTTTRRGRGLRLLVLVSMPALAPQGDGACEGVNGLDRVPDGGAGVGVVVGGGGGACEQ
jgi:hypothetical protein